MEAIKTLELNEKKLEIFVDESPESPREWDNIGTMLCSHNRYNLGDKNDWFKSNHYDSWNEVKEAIMKRFDIGLILPMYMLDHSGICLSTKDFKDRWDSGQVGFIYVTKEKLRNEYSCKNVTKKVIEKAEKCLIGEVETYSQYVEGSVYGFKVSDSEGTELDSCYGFYGNDFANNGICDHLDTDLAELLKIS